ncbi:hypothetical protein BDV28DRAFT_81638 [Aspergillus coremiiformis]|uniref:Uncharacterized protein n=1 Tax=Aspergillus coremiiformis TaxID=138285 RepID=A0A5N6YTC4_9EURO|nr:hypothetical protein BDV28DRAFT_81638 [Aspergillus coremiiformis]
MSGYACSVVISKDSHTIAVSSIVSILDTSSDVLISKVTEPLNGTYLPITRPSHLLCLIFMDSRIAVSLDSVRLEISLSRHLISDGRMEAVGRVETMARLNASRGYHQNLEGFPWPVSLFLKVTGPRNATVPDDAYYRSILTTSCILLCMHVVRELVRHTGRPYDKGNHPLARYGSRLIEISGVNGIFLIPTNVPREPIPTGQR